MTSPVPIPQEWLARARDFPSSKRLKDHCKFVHKLNTGLSRLSAEKQRENVYKFSAAVYRFSAVSTDYVQHASC